jgi:hypothetical protein
MKVVILAGGLGTRLAEENRDETKTNGTNRRQTYSLAHHEYICYPG